MFSSLCDLSTVNFGEPVEKGADNCIFRDSWYENLNICYSWSNVTENVIDESSGAVKFSLVYVQIILLNPNYNNRLSSCFEDLSSTSISMLKSPATNTLRLQYALQKSQSSHEDPQETGQYYRVKWGVLC